MLNAECRIRHSALFFWHLAFSIRLWNTSGFRGRSCFVILNLFPYNNGHLMVIPNRHIASLVAATPDELSELIALTRVAEVALTEAYAPHGINMGINIG